MGRYSVAQRYSAWRDGQRYGPWAPGDEVELDGADAAWVERDSPGTLRPVQPPASPPPTERAAAPSRDRQHRGGRNRAGK